MASKTLTRFIAYIVFITAKIAQIVQISLIVQIVQISLLNKKINKTSFSRGNTITVFEPHDEVAIIKN